MMLMILLGQINCFAFVEFARPDGADDLITTMVSQLPFRTTDLS